jgi:hypothetical protein
MVARLEPLPLVHPERTVIFPHLIVRLPQHVCRLVP